MCALLPCFWVNFFHQAGQLFQGCIHPRLNKETKALHTLKETEKKASQNKYLTQNQYIATT